MVVIEGVDLDALNYTAKYPYNGTIPTGGDSLTENLNIWYEVGLRALGLLSARACVRKALTAASHRAVISRG